MNAIACPVCKNKNSYFFTKKNNFSLYKCEHCKLLFIYPLPPSLEHIYTEEYFSGAEDGYGYADYDADKLPMVPTFKKYLDIQKKYRPGKGALLDVGAATGFFMEMAREDSWKVTGVELSEYAVRSGKKKGLDIRVGDIHTAHFPKNSFDAITMFDVVEHMTNPELDIQEAAKLLKPEGILVINTPDAQSLFARVLGKRWHLIVPPEHIHYFNPHNLGLLLKRNGFEILEVKKIGKKFTLQYVLKTMYKWSGYRVWNSLAEVTHNSFLKHVSLPINLRDNFFLIAKKN